MVGDVTVGIVVVHALVAIFVLYCLVPCRYYLGCGVRVGWVVVFRVAVAVAFHLFNPFI